MWFTADPLLVNPTTKIAFLFPGFEPEFEPRVDDVADHFRLARPNLSGGDELVERSLDIIAVGRLLADALGRIGVTPDVMAGHSLGEWTAMIASGLYDRAVDRRVRGHPPARAWSRCPTWSTPPSAAAPTGPRPPSPASPTSPSPTTTAPTSR